MPAQLTATANDILNRVAAEVGIDPVSDPWSSTDKSYTQLKTLLNIAGEELSQNYPWEFLIKEHSFTTDGVDNEYTLPSDFLRGRITLALYRQMNVLDCVVSTPEGYVERAVRLGTDRDFREGVRARIREASGVLFENAAGVRELEAFFRQVARRL